MGLGVILKQVNPMSSRALSAAIQSNMRIIRQFVNDLARACMLPNERRVRVTSFMQIKIEQKAKLRKTEESRSPAFFHFLFTVPSHYPTPSLFFSDFFLQLSSRFSFSRSAFQHLC